MAYIPGKTYLAAEAYGRGYIALYANVGNRRPRVVYGANKRAIIFPSKDEALAAAVAQIQKSEPDLTGFRAAGGGKSADKIAADALDIAGWREGKERQRDEDRKVFPRAGQKPVEVLTVKRRHAHV